MKKSLEIRAIYNKNSDMKLLSFVDEVDKEILKQPRGGCIAGSIQPDISMFDLVGHLVYAGIFLYQILHRKGVKASYNKNFLNMRVDMRPDPSESYEDLKSLLMKFDDALIEFTQTVDLSTIDLEDYPTPPAGNFFAPSPASWLEHLFSHQIHHRGQISQILSELGVGYDISQFRIYAFTNDL